MSLTQPASRRKWWPAGGFLRPGAGVAGWRMLLIELYRHVRRCTIQVMVTMNASEARAVLPDLLSRVEGGEEVTITRHGRPVAVLVRPDALRSRRASAAFDGAEAIHQLLAAAASAPPDSEGLTEARADELIAEIRAGRDAR